MVFPWGWGATSPGQGGQDLFIPFIKLCVNVYMDPYARGVDMSKSPRLGEELNIEFHPYFPGKMRDMQGLTLLPLLYSHANMSFPAEVCHYHL